MPEGLTPSKERLAMRNFRRLPPLLRVASILGLLFPLGFFIAMVAVLVTSLASSHQSGFYPSRVAVIALNLGAVGGACTVAVHTYSMRFRQPGRGPFPLDSWQSQVRALLLSSALPIGALVLAVVSPPTSLAFGMIVFPITLFGMGVALAVSLVERGVASRRLAQTPRIG